MEPSTIALIITAVAVVCFVTEIIPFSVTAIAASIAMALFGVISFSDVYAGFGNDTILLCIGVMIIGNACFETGLAEKIGSALSKSFARSERTFLISLMIAAALVSMFMSNVAVVAMFIPIVSSVAENSNGKIDKRNIFLPMGIASCVGGLCTLIGSPPQMVAQALLIEGGYREIGFFELSIVGLPLMALLVIYFLTIGPKLLRGKTTKLDSGNVKEAMQTEEIREDPKRRTKQIICLTVLIACVVAFVAQVLTNGIIAMLGASIMIITGCIGDREAYKKLDWSTILFTAGTLGFANGITVSGAGDLIANSIIGVLGENTSPIIILMVLMGCATLITSIISNTAATALLVPIGISIASNIGMNVTTVVIGIVIGASLSFATPIAAPAMTMTSGLGEYKFMDFVKCGSLFSVLSYLVAVVAIVLFMPL